MKVDEQIARGYLASPVSGKILHFSANKTELVTCDGAETFRMVDGVPLLLRDPSVAQ